MRRTTKPDTRLSWRDPNMPVLRDYIMGDGSTKVVVDQDYEHRYREHLLSTDNTHPHYKDDDTYDLKRQRKRL